MTPTSRSRILVALSAGTAALVTAGGLAGSALAVGHHDHDYDHGAARPAALHAVAPVGAALHSAATPSAAGHRAAGRSAHAEARTQARTVARRLVTDSYQRHDGRLSVVPVGTPGTVRPEITGHPMVGQVLRAVMPRVRGVRYSFQWLIGGHPVRGATGPTYRLRGADEGRSVAVEVAAVRRGVAHISISHTIRHVAPPYLQLRVAPSVHGAVRVGRTLIATPGVWRAAHPTFSYRWYAGRRSLGHATSPRLVLTRALAGHTVSVQITAHHKGYTPTTVTARVRGAVRG